MQYSEDQWWEAQQEQMNDLRDAIASDLPYVADESDEDRDARIEEALNDWLTK
jgi:hypothetical protein